MTERVYLSRGKSIDEMQAEKRGEPITLRLHEGDLQQMMDDANEAEITLALIHQALMFVSRSAEYHTANIEAVLELLARATTDEAAPWSARLSVAVGKLQASAQGDPK